MKSRIAAPYHPRALEAASGQANAAAQSELAVVWVPIDQLKPYPGNARRHSKKQVHQIAASVRQFRFINPAMIDSENGIIAGHGRVAAAKLLGMTHVPCIRVEHLSEAEKRAYVIADNRLTENAGWDRDLLKIELEGLEALDLDFDLEITGFDAGDIDVIIDGGDVLDKGAEKVLGRKAARQRQPDPADEVPETDTSTPAITQAGTIWTMGDHRLFCGDATKPESYDAVLGRGSWGTSDVVDLVFTDPPYNVPIEGHVSGLGKITHREFAMASGEMTEAEFTAFLSRIFVECARVSRDGSIHYVCMDWRHMAELLAAAKATYGELKNLCVWNKDNAGMGALYRSKHELVFVFKRGEAPHVNNVNLGAGGRYRTNVWDYAGVNSFAGRDDLEMHPTVKPVALVADAIRDCSKRGGIVLDPFGGSGTTLIAAEKTKRKARLIEIDPHYCDTIVSRWQKLTGEQADQL